jgi:hypothetical protein
MNRLIIIVHDKKLLKDIVIIDRVRTGSMKERDLT